MGRAEWRMTAVVKFGAGRRRSVASLDGDRGRRPAVGATTCLTDGPTRAFLRLCVNKLFILSTALVDRLIHLSIWHACATYVAWRMPAVCKNVLRGDTHTHSVIAANTKIYLFLQTVT